MVSYSKKYGSGSSGNPVSGTGGISGQGGSVSGVQRTAAGSPSGWYNIQDFMGANQQKPEIRNRIEEKGQQQIGQATSQFNQQQQNLQDMPTANAYSDDTFNSMLEGGISQDEAGQLQSNIAQTLGNVEAGTQDYEKSAQEQMPDIANPFESIQPGNFNSLMSWYGDAEPASSQYTPGMGKMDEMLLRGQKGFAEEYPSQVNQQYQQNVAEPQQQKRKEVQGQQDKLKGEGEGSYAAERGNWTGGIQNFMSGEQDKINTALSNQQAEQAKLGGYNTDEQLNAAVPEQYNEIFNQANEFNGQETPLPIAGGNTPQYTGHFPVPNAAALFGGGNTPQYDPYAGQIDALDYGNYLNRPGYFTSDPNMNTAALFALGDQGLASYNTLGGVMGTDPSQIYAGEQYTPGDWQFNQGNFDTDYGSRVNEYVGLAQAGERERIDAALRDLAAQQEFIIPTGGTFDQYKDQIGNFSVPEQFEMMRDYGIDGTNVQDTGHKQAGEQVYAPWHIARQVSDRDRSDRRDSSSGYADISDDMYEAPTGYLNEDGQYVQYSEFEQQLANAEEDQRKRNAEADRIAAEKKKEAEYQKKKKKKKKERGDQGFYSGGGQTDIGSNLESGQSYA